MWINDNCNQTIVNENGKYFVQHKNENIKNHLCWCFDFTLVVTLFVLHCQEPLVIFLLFIASNSKIKIVNFKKIIFLFICIFNHPCWIILIIFINKNMKNVILWKKSIYNKYVNCNLLWIFIMCYPLRLKLFLANK